MAHNSTAQFLTAWRGLQDTPQKAPARDAFDPTRMKTLMPQMLMLAAGDHRTGGFNFRLAGGFIEQLHGPGLKGSDFTALFAPAFQAPLIVALTSARHREQPLLLCVTTEVGDDLLSAEILLTPLRNQDGLIDRFVGLYQPLGPQPDAFRLEAHYDTNLPRAGRLSLKSARLQTADAPAFPAHLRLVSIEGRLIA
ncbi:PAS domain-containing protein [Asticcacaulis sp. BYS171W]|uniref:PAS domain-containing protein n=1 Tax=Asticcacaulis aquaticus TaxID=2984212 RepID=A0ABT5HYV9_9CAUL|nr:PAS domain-containing protein [Asticcacaulis aquaticus]MDC7685249.1 PAS domain-containing protein [Asticcacaulis aquaticus]